MSDTTIRNKIQSSLPTYLIDTATFTGSGILASTYFTIWMNDPSTRLGIALIGLFNATALGIASYVAKTDENTSIVFKIALTVGIIVITASTIPYLVTRLADRYVVILTSSVALQVGILHLAVKASTYALYILGVRLGIGKSTKMAMPLNNLIPWKINELRGLAKYEALLAENKKNIISSPFIPTRRVCSFGTQDSTKAIGKITSSIFITDEEIVEEHPMRFLSNSPFVSTEPSPGILYIFNKPNHNEEIFNLLIAKMYAISITPTNKHVILQQTSKSCVPTCVAMLLLDHGKKPDYASIKKTYLATDDKAITWIKKGGLIPKRSDLSNEYNRLELLVACLNENGPGILFIYHPEISCHAIILDEISKKTKTAMIRDPYHGRALTIKLDTFLSWVDEGSSFIQVSK